jgi:hypothetical protein
MFYLRRRRRWLREESSFAHPGRKGAGDKVSPF